jgi:hypothetical protein
VSSLFWALNACGLWISRLSGPMTAGCTDRKSCTEERNGTLDITWYNPKYRQKKNIQQKPVEIGKKENIRELPPFFFKRLDSLNNWTEQQSYKQKT